jgi:shikimate dehydrogenase
MLECFDFYFPEDGKWYPRLLYYEAIHRVLIERARDLDIRVPAFVVGEGECLRIAAAVCTELGYSEIYLIGENTQQLHREARLLSRGNLGIKFRVLPIEELTMQAVNASLIVNTIHLKSDSDLLKDLSYFNFMNTGGYAFDCNLGNLQSELMEEAERAELKVLLPTDLLQALVEIVFEKLKQSELVSRADLKEWVKSFKEQNSSSV